MTDPYLQTDGVTLFHGDCLDVLRELPDESVHSVVTDPPYGLSNTDHGHVTEAITHWTTGDRAFLPSTGGGFMGKAWDEFVPPPAVWDECMRVLKPGGHLIAFAGSRTVDLMALSIRLAGFDIRDSIAWLYGSGFPKSLDVAKAIDKAGGESPEAQARVLKTARERAGHTRRWVADRINCTEASVRDWEEGRARAKGGPVEYVMASPAYRAAIADLLGYSADERAVVGVADDRRGDGSVIGLGHSGKECDAATTDAAKAWEGWGTALKPAFEPIVVARKPLAGTVAANVLAHGTGALNIDASRTAGVKGVPASPRRAAQGAAYGDLGKDPGTGTGWDPNAGRWPANVVLDESQAAALDEQTGVLTSGYMAAATERSTRQGAALGKMPAATAASTYGDSGGASRMFPTFHYEAKAPTSERPVVDGVAHPTVKPLGLMRWLVRLVTPKGGTVLEPFAGSGTTVEACLREGFDVIAIEREADYLPLIEKRIRKDHVQGLDFDWGDAS